MYKLSRVIFAALVAGMSFVSFGADTPPSGVTLVDLTTADSGSVVSAGTPYSDNRGAAKAFDESVGGDATRWLTKDVANAWFIYKFNTPTVLTSYTIVNGGDGGANQAERAPKTWTLCGSNDEGDEKTWTTLDSRSGETKWSSKESRYYNCQQVDYVPYTYYKFACTENNGNSLVQIHEIYFYDTRDYHVKNVALTPVGDGTYRLTGTLQAAEAGETKAVFSAPGAANIELSLGELKSAEAIDYIFDPMTVGLSKSAIYTAEVVVPDGQSGVSTPVSGEIYLGEKATLPGEFNFKLPIALSESVKTLLADKTYTDFPVLVRLSSAISGFDYTKLTPGFRGRDLLFTDENGASLAFEVEEWNPEGESLVWVKVPSLSAATEITCYFSGKKLTDAALKPEDTWTKYVGVWHFATSEAGSQKVKDSTGHALDATANAPLQTVASPFGGSGLTAGAVVRAPDYEPGYGVGATFTASGWFKAASFASSDYVTVAKKKGSTWNADNGWYIELSGNNTSCKLILTDSTTATVSDFTQNWHYYDVVSDGSTVKLYLDGSTSAKISQNYKVKANSEPYTILSSKLIGDEYRIRKSAASAAETQLEYQTMAKKDFFSFGTVESMDASMPAVAANAIERLADGSFRVTAEIALAEPKAVYAVVNDVEYPMTGAAGELPRQYEVTLTDLAADKTYGYGIKVVSMSDNDMTVGGDETFSTGSVTIEKTADADELGLVPGAFVVRRTDIDRDLVVSYVIDAGSTAVAGKNYEALSGTVTIPAGQTEATIVLTPINDALLNEDSTLTLNLSDGLYTLGAEGKTSATMTIKNLPPPEGWNVWVAHGDSTLASLDANWSAGHAPRADEKVLFDGRFSMLNCTWDAAAPQTVTGWKQAEGYTGTVTFETTFASAGETFTNLTVKGDVTLESGTWTHKDHKAAAEKSQVYHLSATVEGDFTLGASAQLMVSGKGQRVKQSFCGACYGGTGGKYVDQNGKDELSVFGETYGSVTEPTDLGMSAGADGGYSGSDPVAWAGGAIYLKVGGTLAIAGNVYANGMTQKGWNTSTGSGGSIYLEAAAITGNGNVQANGGGGGGSNCNQCGSGGRIALVTKADELGLPIDKVTVQGGSVYAYQAGSGTIFVKTGTSVYGTLYMKFNNVYGAYAYHPTYRLTTAIPSGQTWTFDAIVFSGKGVLRVPTGTKLVLPNGLGSVTGNDYESGIVMDGGTLDVPSALASCEGQWMLMMHADTVIPCALTLNGPKIGVVSSFRRIAKDFDGQQTVTVNGPVTLEGTSTFDLFGDAYTTGKIKQGSAKLTTGDYTAALANEAGVTGVLDSSSDKSGLLKIKSGGLTLLFR